MNLFHLSPLIVQMEHQDGTRDCGAVSTALAFQKDPSMLNLEQAAMRPHL